MIRFSGTDLYHILSKICLEALPFAIYRLPNSDELYLVCGKVQLLYSYQELSQKRGFVLAPFHLSDSTPILLLESGDQITKYPIASLIEGSQSTSDKPNNKPNTPYSTEYQRRFKQFMEAMQTPPLQKLVLSRFETIEVTPDFSTIDTFARACTAYPSAFVYLCHMPESGSWLGSTPELLLSGQNSDWHTVALAGTQTEKGRWDDKNRQEQAYVSYHIRECLQQLGIKPKESAPCTIAAGRLWHLKSDFEFTLLHKEQLGKVVELLHPTPAVCGYPKEEAQQFILAHEGYPRSYYSGFVGWIDSTNHTDLYVNIRCMQIADDNKVTTYAGGGLTLESELQQEWHETECKLQTMQSLLE